MGSTFTLTPKADFIPGTSGNDTILGYVGAGISTLTPADILNGGAGIDTLVISADGAKSASLPATNISNIEVFQITDVAIAPSLYNFSKVAGVTSVVNALSTNFVTLSSIPSGAGLTICGDGVTANGSTTFTMSSATTAVTLNLVGGLAGANPGSVFRAQTGAAAITVNSYGLPNKINILDFDTGTALTGLTIMATANLTASLGLDYATKSVLTISGNATKVDLSGAILSGNFSLLDASGMNAGGVTVKLGSNATQFIGGAGDDSVAVDALAFTKVAVAAGSGFDSLRLSDQAALTSTTVVNLTGFEELVLADDNDNLADTFDISLLTGITSLKLNTNSVMDAYVLNNISPAQAASITITGSLAAAPTFNAFGATTAGQTDTLSIAINDGAATTSTITTTNLIAAGVEIVNIAATDNFTATSMTGLTALTQLTITGTGATNLTTGALAINANTVVDASVATGNFTFTGKTASSNGLTVFGSASKVNTITGTPQADVIIGGADNDAIAGGAGGDFINVGEGADTILLTTAADSFFGAVITSGATILAGVDVVSGMGPGDKISLAKMSASFTGAAETTIAAATGTTASVVTGDYNTATGVFTAAGGGADTLFVYDADASGVATNLGAIVLVGFAATGATGVAGAFTLA